MPWTLTVAAEVVGVGVLGWCWWPEGVGWQRGAAGAGHTAGVWWCDGCGLMVVGTLSDPVHKV
jgi:hypothetical protein